MSAMRWQAEQRMGGQGVRVPAVGKATVAAVMEDVTRPSQ